MSRAIRVIASLAVAAVAPIGCSSGNPAPKADGGVVVDGGVPIDGGVPVDGGSGDAGVAVSTCESPQHCNEAETCLRVRTAEGDARCGAMPPCDTRYCTTSADCAPLGAGYFCDTPNSGCCNDGQLPRCLPPCGLHDGWPPGLPELVNELDTFDRGGPSDLDRDGYYETTTTLGDGGVRTIEVRGAGKGVILTVVFPDATHVTAQGDFNEDTRIDFTESEVRTGNRLDHTAEWDTDFDGNMDRRLVRSFDLAARTFTSTVYRLGDGGFQQESSRSGPSQDDQGGGNCNGLDGFPADVSGHARSPYERPNIRIIQNNTPGACTADQARRLVEAFQKILLDSMKCLQRTNPLLKTKLANALAEKTLNIGCGNTCQGKGGTTQFGSWMDVLSLDPLKMNINFSAASDDHDLQAIVLHELNHFAGDNHTGGEDGQGGTDNIYSCSRHCAGCSDWGHGARNSPGNGWSKERDCARCAAPGFKGLCGTQTAYVKKCDTLRELCHSGLGGNALCEECLYSEEQYCDDTPTGNFSAGRHVCCKSCPANYTTNDDPCGAQMEGVVTPCPALPAGVCP